MSNSPGIHADLSNGWVACVAGTGFGDHPPEGRGGLFQNKTAADNLLFDAFFYISAKIKIPVNSLFTGIGVFFAPSWLLLGSFLAERTITEPIP